MLLGNDEPFPFLAEDREADITGEVDIVFDVLGVEISEDFFSKGDIGFFFARTKFPSFLLGPT